MKTQNKIKNTCCVKKYSYFELYSFTSNATNIINHILTEMVKDRFATGR